MQNWRVWGLCFEKDSYVEQIVPVYKIQLCLSYCVALFQLNFFCILDA